MEIAHIIITGINLGSLVLISVIIAVGLYRVFGNWKRKKDNETGTR